MRSAKKHSEVIAEYIRKECKAGSCWAHLTPRCCRRYMSAGWDHPPKADLRNWRLILDLLSPEGASVNDGIDPRVCSLSYVTVDYVARTIERVGMGAKLAKVDFKSAY